MALAPVCKSHDGAGHYKGRGRWRTVCICAPKADGAFAVCDAGDRDAEEVEVPVLRPPVVDPRGGGSLEWPGPWRGCHVRRAMLRRAVIVPRQPPPPRRRKLAGAQVVIPTESPVHRAFFTYRRRTATALNKQQRRNVMKHTNTETRRAYLRGYLIAVPASALVFAIMLFVYAVAMKRHGLI